MNPRKRAILEKRGGEIAKAGRMFFDAVFGDSEKFIEERGQELDHELARRGAIVVDGELLDEDDPTPPRRPLGPPQRRPPQR